MAEIIKNQDSRRVFLDKAFRKIAEQTVEALRVEKYAVNSGLQEAWNAAIQEAEKKEKEWFS